MNTFVSGESDAKGLSVILPYIAVGPAAVAIRRPELLNAWNGHVGRGKAWRGLSEAWNKGGHIRKNNKPTQHNRMTKKDWQPFETAPKDLNSVVLATWGTHNFVGGHITIAKTESGWEDTLDRTRQFNEVGKNIKDNGYWLLQWTPIAKLFIWS